MNNEEPAFQTSSPERILHLLAKHDRRVLLFGEAGIGKSTLASQLAGRLSANSRQIYCISADPGSPGFGVPGAISIAKWNEPGWHVIDYQALCSLDAARFRLPLVSAVRHLTQRFDSGLLFIDSPGVVRGVAASELLDGLIEAGKIDTIIALAATGKTPPLYDELQAQKSDLHIVAASPAAKRPGKRVRARTRTERWNIYLQSSHNLQVNLENVAILGTPPPREQTSAWLGRLVALLDDKQCVTMAEVISLSENILTVKASEKIERLDGILIRDALRNTNGLIETAIPYLADRLNYIPEAENLFPASHTAGPRVSTRMGSAEIALMNGVFGDPLVHLRLLHHRRSLLFDLGDSASLPAKVIHQVSDIFITHAHMDHINGFIGLLRARIGEFPMCRIFGPPGLAKHIEGFIQGVLWDRIADRGPEFEVIELHKSQMERFQIKVGQLGLQYLGSKMMLGDTLITDQAFKIKAITLDHGTPVIAYAFEHAMQINIRKDQLNAYRVQPGPWLSELKKQILAENFRAEILLPNGKTENVAVLAEQFVLLTPGKKLVYATDFADTKNNRAAMQAFAKNAHTFFCEASYLEADRKHAVQNGHLTTCACGEIAQAAEVARLIPFHFSHRNIQQIQKIYEEIEAVCSRVAKPITL